MSLKSWLSYQLAEKNIFIRKTIPRPSTKIAKKLFGDNPITFAEIGVFEGRNTLNVVKELKVKEALLIDPYIEYNDGVEGGIGGKVVKGKEKAHKRIDQEEVLLNTKVNWIEDYSENVSDKFENNKIDFIYIDGNHEYESVKKDLELYWPKVKEGGIMAGHDIDHLGVMQAVGEFTLKHGIKAILVFPDWIIIKEGSS